MSPHLMRTYWFFHWHVRKGIGMENILDDDLVASVSTVDDLPLPDQLVKFPIKNNHEHYSWD